MADDQLSDTPLADAIKNIVPDGKHVAVEVELKDGKGTVEAGVSLGDHVEIVAGVTVEKKKKPTVEVKGKIVW